MAEDDPFRLFREFESVSTKLSRPQVQLERTEAKKASAIGTTPVAQLYHGRLGRPHRSFVFSKLTCQLNVRSISAVKL